MRKRGGTTTLTINVRVFLCSIFNGREACPKTNGVHRRGAQLCSAIAMRKRGGTTTLTINVRVFLCSIFNGREACPNTNGVHRRGAQLCSAIAMRKRGGTTTLTINVRVFLCSIINGLGLSEAISRPKGVILSASCGSPALLRYS
jgi:ribosomal protein L27